MSERATVQFKTKSGVAFELREYLTGREKRHVKNAMWQGKNMKVKDGKGESDPIPMTDIDASTDKTIELMVVSVNGKKEKVLELVLDLPSNDYDELLEKIEELTGPIASEKKADGSDSTET